MIFYWISGISLHRRTFKCQIWLCWKHLSYRIPECGVFLIRCCTSLFEWWNRFPFIYLGLNQCFLKTIWIPLAIKVHWMKHILLLKGWILPLMMKIICSLISSLTNKWYIWFFESLYRHLSRITTPCSWWRLHTLYSLSYSCHRNIIWADILYVLRYYWIRFGFFCCMISHYLLFYLFGCVHLFDLLQNIKSLLAL